MINYARRWFPSGSQVAPQEVVTLTPLIYPANSFWSVGRPKLMACSGTIPMNLALLGSTQLYSRTVLSCCTKAGAAGGCQEYPLKVTGGLDNCSSVGSLFRPIPSSPIKV